MLKRAMQILGKMVRQFTTPSMQAGASHLLNVNKQLVKFGQAYWVAELQVKPVASKQNKEQSVAPSTTQEASLSKDKQTVQAETGVPGKRRKIPVKGIVQRAKRANKAKR